MIYAKKLILPGEGAEMNVILEEKRTCFTTVYPFKIFPQKQLREVELEGITIFCGGNGSGKSTLINVMAEKMNAVRYCPFNTAPFFDRFLRLCRIEYLNRPARSYVLTSDDVFDYVLQARSVNERLDDRRSELFEEYVRTHRQAMRDPGVGRLKGLDDYERWSRTRDILSPRKSQSSFIREQVAREVDLRSNGETAMAYFLDRIDADGVYFLDEPENSLSVEYQLQLAEYIAAVAHSARCQFVIATHSPILLAIPGARIYDLDADPATVCRWTELPNVRRYFDFFMEHRAQFENGGPDT